jgi:hypothetical protein
MLKARPYRAKRADKRRRQPERADKRRPEGSHVLTTIRARRLARESLERLGKVVHVREPTLGGDLPHGRVGVVEQVLGALYAQVQKELVRRLPDRFGKTCENREAERPARAAMSETDSSSERCSDLYEVIQCKNSGSSEDSELPRE